MTNKAYNLRRPRMTSEEINKLVKQKREEIKIEIEKLSELKSNYNCFDDSEELYYRALEDAIRLMESYYNRIGETKNGRIVGI